MYITPRQCAVNVSQPDGSMPVPTDSIFDYSVVDPDTAALARATADRIRADMNRMRVSAIERGRDLLSIEKRLGHGHFGRWLQSEFGDVTARSAYNWMQAARVFGNNSETVSELPERIIYSLASPSTPTPVREEVLHRLDAGNITVDEIKRKIEDGRKLARQEKLLSKQSPKARTAAAAKSRRRRAEQDRHRAERDAQQARDLEAAQAAAGRIRDRLGEGGVIFLLAELDSGVNLFTVIEQLRKQIEGAS